MMDQHETHEENPAATLLRQRIIEAIGRAMVEDHLRDAEVPDAVLRCLLYSMYATVRNNPNKGLVQALEWLDRNTRRMWTEMDAIWTQHGHAGQREN